MLKGAISTQINIPEQYIELELDGTIVSIDIFIGGDRGAPVGNLTGSSGDSSGGSGGTGGSGGSSGGQSLADLAAAQTAQIADSTMKYAEEILELTMKPSFMGDISGTIAVPIYIVDRPLLQEVILLAPSPPPPIPPPPSPPPYPPYPPAPPHMPPPFVCHPVYGIGDCSEHNFCGELAL